MSEWQTGQRLQQVVDELGAMAAQIDGAQLNALADILHQAPAVFFSGQGRSGLMVKALAIRLMHIGLKVYVAGESSTPAIAEGEWLVAVSSSAKTPATLAHIAAARQAGASIALISAAEAPTIQADLTLVLPARSQVPTSQHAGSLFEQSLLLAGDAMAWRVQHLRGQADAQLDRRHANLQ